MAKLKVAEAAQAVKEEVQETVQSMKEKLASPDPAADPVIQRLEAVLQEMKRHHRVVEEQMKLQYQMSAAIKMGVENVLKGVDVIIKRLTPKPAASTPAETPQQPAQQPAPVQPVSSEPSWVEKLNKKFNGGN